MASLPAVAIIMQLSRRLWKPRRYERKRVRRQEYIAAASLVFKYTARGVYIVFFFFAGVHYTGFWKYNFQNENEIRGEFSK